MRLEASSGDPSQGGIRCEDSVWQWDILLRSQYRAKSGNFILLDSPGNLNLQTQVWEVGNGRLSLGDVSLGVETGKIRLGAWHG